MPSVAKGVAILFGIGLVGAVTWLATVKWEFAVVVAVALGLVVALVGGYRVWRSGTPDMAAGGPAALPMTVQLVQLARRGRALEKSWKVFAPPQAVKDAEQWTTEVHALLFQEDPALAERFSEAPDDELVTFGSDAVGHAIRNRQVMLARLDVLDGILKAHDQDEKAAGATSTSSSTGPARAGG